MIDDPRSEHKVVDHSAKQKRNPRADAHQSARSDHDVIGFDGDGELIDGDTADLWSPPHQAIESGFKAVRNGQKAEFDLGEQMVLFEQFEQSRHPTAVDEDLGFEDTFFGVAGMQRIHHNARCAASGKGCCSSLIKRRLSGNANRTPKNASEIIHNIVVPIGITRLVMIMYAARLAINGEVI